MRWLFIALAAMGCKDAFGLEDPIAAGLNQIVMSGKTVDVGGGNLVGTTVAWEIDPTSEVKATTTSDANGVYALAIPFNGTALDGHLHVSHANYMEGYYYPAEPLTEDLQISLGLITPGTFNGLCMIFQQTCTSTDATVALVVYGSGNPLAGAVVGPRRRGEQGEANDWGDPAPG